MDGGWRMRIGGARAVDSKGAPVTLPVRRQMEVVISILAEMASAVQRRV